MSDTDRLTNLIIEDRNARIKALEKELGQYKRSDKVLKGGIEWRDDQLQKLREFAKHKAHCQFSMSYGDDACNCGLDELLNQSK